MRLIIGGAFQGKLEYAQKTYRITEGWIDGRSCEPGAIGSCRGIHHFHEYIKRMLEAGADSAADRETVCFKAGDLTRLEQQAEQFADWLCRTNPELVVVSNELGYGIVPMEQSDRLWRETVGRICTCLAARAEEVVRVVCGLGIRLK